MGAGDCPGMSRRRPSFATYVARRWRVLGLVAVLLLGSLLVLGITDRGHEPLWSARTGPIDRAAVSPDGSAVYALIREGGNLTRLEARDGASGGLLWESALHAPRALLAAGSEGVAVATDFPLAFLTAYGVDGSVRYQVPLEGNPRALAVEGARLALALQAPGNPVLVFEGDRLARTHTFGSFVKAIDLRAGRLAAGTGEGEVALFHENGTAAYNASLPMSVRSLQMTRDGLSFLVGGSSLAAGDLSGVLAFVDTGRREPLLWTAPAPGSVGLVGLDDAGLWALSVEEAPPYHSLRVREAATGEPRWMLPVEGFVARDDSGSSGGAALSPDGRAIVVGTLRGDVQALRVQDGRARWSFLAEGTTQVAFARDAPGLVLANGRLVTGGPYASAFLFSVDAEPLASRLPVLAAVLAAVAVLAAASIVGVGYWRVVRRAS